MWSSVEDGRGVRFSIFFKAREVERAMWFLYCKEIDCIVSVVGKVVQVRAFVAKAIYIPGHELNVVVFGTF